MLAFSNDYYGFIFRATQSVELFCAYEAKKAEAESVLKKLLAGGMSADEILAKLK